MGIRRLLVPLALVACLALAACSDDTTTVTVDPGVDPQGTAPEAGEAPSGEDEDPARQIERWIFDLVNEERAERGIEPLEWSDQLTASARDWSAEMAERGGIEHADPQAILDQTEGLMAVGENVFEATGPVPAARIHIGWMESDGHRRNVLDPGFDRLGVGIVCTEDGAVFATQRFGSSGAGPWPSGDEVPPQEPIVAEADQGPTC